MAHKMAAEVCMGPVGLKIQTHNMVVMRLQTGDSTGEVCGNTSGEIGVGGGTKKAQKLLFGGGQAGGGGGFFK